MRLALKTPELFIEAVRDNLAYYDARNADSKKLALEDFTFDKPPPDTKEVVQKALEALNITDDLNVVTMRKALEYAVELGKLHLVYIYLHDKDTPALGDRYMLAKAKIKGQYKRFFSEDEKLQQAIGRLVGHLTSDTSKI